jgi:hypothetical protein
MIYNPKIPLGLRKETRGYRIRQTNGIPRKKALDDIWESKLMADHLRQNQWSELATKVSLATAAHEAFKTMFKFDQLVISRAREFKASAGISGPYVGMHMRKGDTNMGVEGQSEAELKGLIHRASDNEDMLMCYHQIKSSHPNAFDMAYLACDDVSSKQKMANADSSIHFAKEILPFHVDLLAREGKTKRNDPDEPRVYNAVVDTWAEMLVLAESTCLILSRSMFSFGSLFMRNPQSCAVPIFRCAIPAHREGRYEYYAESIYDRGFIFFESLTSD